MNKENVSEKINDDYKNIKGLIENYNEKMTKKLNENRKKLKEKYDYLRNEIETIEIKKNNYNKKIEKVKKDFKEKYQINKINEDIKNYSKFLDEINKNKEELNNDIIKEKINIREKKLLIIKYRKILKQVLKENINLKSLSIKMNNEINKNNIDINESKNIEEINSNKNNNFFITEDNYKEKKHIFDNCNKIYDIMINKIYQDINVFNKFKDCLNIYYKFLIKDQKITKKEGLNGSLLFEILNNIGKCNITNIRLPKKSLWFQSQSNIQDRNIIQLIYYTLKNLNDSKENPEKIKLFKIDYNSFMNYTPLQILGILCLKIEIIEEILSEWEIYLNNKLEKIKKYKNSIKYFK